MAEQTECTGVVVMMVNEVASAAGVQPHVVRYYARIGLLNPRRDPENGYRRFAGHDVQRLHFIRLAQEAGCSLTDIRQLLDALDAGQVSGDALRELLVSRLRALRNKVAELEARELAVRRALEHFEDNPVGSSDIGGWVNWMRCALKTPPPN